MSDTFRPVMPHGPLEEIFDGVFVVSGSHAFGPGVRIGRNMTVVKRGRELTILNSVRLTDEGERALAKLGTVKHLVRLGYFHGVDDPYFMAKYTPTFWSGERMVPTNVQPELRHDLLEGGELPVPGRVFRFQGGRFDEAAVVLDVDGGVLVTCDSLQNWTDTRGCSLLGGVMMRAMGFMAPAKVGGPWLKKMTDDDPPKLAAEFERLLALPFRHLLSGHGAPLRDDAHAKATASVRATFGPR